MRERGDEASRDVRPGDPVLERERERTLGHHERVPPAGAIQQHARPYDRVVHSAATDFGFGPAAPDQGIPFVQVQATGGERGDGHPARGHVEEAPSKFALPRRRQHMTHTVVFCGFDPGFGCRMAAATPGWRIDDILYPRLDNTSLKALLTALP